MKALFLKEFFGYLHSLIAFLVIGVFLLITGLLTWVFPETSVLQYGFADLAVMFNLAPYVFLVIVPAITMRSLAEERRSGTLEWLLTRPMTEWDIVLAKFLAAVLLVFLALLPTWVYVYSVSALGSPAGNLDLPGIAGSYIGLMLLGAAFCSIGIFASALTSNSIVAFITAGAISMLLYIGLDFISTLPVIGEAALFLRQLGIRYHYDSLGRGLIDSRDLLYFGGVILIFLAATRLLLRSGRNPIRLNDSLVFANIIALVVFLNLAGNLFFLRFDMTEEKRYSIKPQTRQLLESLEEPVFVEVFLEGELNAAFTRFRNSIEETLQEFSIYSRGKVKFVFTDPATATSEAARNEFMASLASRGIQPTRVVDNREGKREEKIILPGALVSVGGMETGITLLKGNKSAPQDEEINQSIEGIEYELDAAIYKLRSGDRPAVGLVPTGDSLGTLDLATSLGEYFRIHYTKLDTTLKQYDVLVISKPVQPFSKAETYLLDQYLQQGGKLVLLMDKLDASMDSASSESYFAWPVETGLEDLLFHYGVRVNPDLIQDLQASLYPVVTGQQNGRPVMEMMDWPFFPVINQYAAHPVTRHLDALQSRFVSTLDTVKAVGIRKTPLAFTSPRAKVFTAPVNVSIPALQRTLDEQSFTQGPLPIGYLLEGQFTSAFRNRILPEGVKASPFGDRRAPGKIAIFSDGDLARSTVDRRSGQPLPMGYDPYTQYQFANRELMVNLMFYMTAEEGLIQVRTRKVELRPLDRVKAREESVYWKSFNLILPLAVLVLSGISLSALRKRKFTTQHGTKI